MHDNNDEGKNNNNEEGNKGGEDFISNVDKRSLLNTGDNKSRIKHGLRSLYQSTRRSQRSRMRQADDPKVNSG